ncbi:MAG: hypothetical protein HOV87_16065 [Catenulispora sp.]|nr:hypothetical protein [Catenulispora sp.]
MTDTWVSAHLFHYGDLDALIAGVVGPVVEQLTQSGAVDRYFFLRYWEGGQHIRLRMRVTELEQQAMVRDLVQARARTYFAANPSAAPISQHDYEAFAARAARGERRQDHDARLRAGDAAEFIVYRPEYSAFGDAECVSAVEEHFTDSSRLALEIVSAGASRNRRAATALATLTTAVAAGAVDLADAASRYAAAQTAAGPEEPLPRASDALYEPHRDALLRQTRRLWELDPERGAAGQWLRSIRRLRDRLELLEAEGRCKPADPGSPHAHLALTAPPPRRTVPLILLRCAHLLHNRLGVDRESELRVCALLGRALIDLADTWR